jgi:acyl-CoA synthetase (AMP-forming)/AMP-acid ligase II
MSNAVSQTQAFALASSLPLSNDLTKYITFAQQAVSSRSSDRTKLLAQIPRTSEPSYGPIATLSSLLETLPGPWPVLRLQQTYTELWKQLPNDAKAGKAPTAAKKLLDLVLRQCKDSYSSMTDLLHPTVTSTAMINPEDGNHLTHAELASCVSEFRLPVNSVPGQTKPVVAISLPNGPTLALTVLAVASFYTAAPVAHGSGVGAEQFKSDILQSQTNLVLAAPADVDRLGLREPWLAEASIEVLLVELSAEMKLQVRDVTGNLRHDSHFWPQPIPNSADDIGIMLFTSGTSGTKKLVPLFTHSLICGAAMVIDSWGLNPDMRCLNQMPLNHVGGLVRNLFSPVMSGGSVICCAAYDANLFWDCVEDHAPTWYYASPSMHQGILEAGADRPETVAKSTIRLICNAAGGLLPSLAHQLKDTFSVSAHTTVLPSYGMTECMPISTPPLNYKLDRTGTSGVSVGPEISILDGNDCYIMDETVGRIAVRGSPVFNGYLKNSKLDTSCFTDEGWFDTGDMGYLDADGFLYITGRSKEVINRGGELISPFEVEEAVVAAGATPDSPVYGRISKALAFSVTHDVLQEVVGIAVVTPEGAPRADLRGLTEAVKSTLSSVKIPVFIVYMDAGVPTNNNKVLRIKLADRLDLPTISDNTPPAERYYEADCPPNNTPLKEPIASRMMEISYDELGDRTAGSSRRYRCARP